MSDEPHPFPIIPTLDLVTPAVRKMPGTLIDCLNHEPVAAGCQRIDGLERVDGQTKPSAATYYVLNFDAGTATIALGATVTGVTSGATGKTLVAMVITSGSFAGSNAAGYLVLELVTGTFVDNENLQVAAVTKCVADGAAALDGALTDANGDTWGHLAIENQRGRIIKVPGEGNILGAWMIGNVMYAVRNAVGGATAALWKSSTAGWVTQALGRELAYTSGGTYEIAEGDTITGATSGATAVVVRITLTSGDWTTGDAVGSIFYATQTGAFQAENLNVGAHANVATIAANSSAITLSPSGAYVTEPENFLGGSATRRIYGVSAVHPAFEFDGTTWVWLRSPLTPDTPSYMKVHKQHLILGYPGGRLVASSLGYPYSFDATLGGVDIGLGDDITGIDGPYSNALVITSRHKTAILYGSDADDFQLVPNSAAAGAIAKTLRLVGTPIYMDEGGLRDLRSGANFGDFNVRTVSSAIEPLLNYKSANSYTPVGSVVVKEKTQYRVYFSDGTGLTFYFGGKNPYVLPFDFTSSLVCKFVGSFRDASNNEVLLFGSDTGYLYQLDSGTSLDGGEIEAYGRLAHNACGSPNIVKRYRRLSLEGIFPDNVDMAYSHEKDYGNFLGQPSVERTMEFDGGGGYWSETDNWNEFNWSSGSVAKIRAKMYMQAENVSTAWITNLTYERPYTLSGGSYNTSMRKVSR